MKSRHEKYKEIIILERLLEESGVRFEIEPLLDGYHIGVPTLDWFGPDKMKYSIIEHFSSYGSILDLLEISGPGGKLQGFLKADDVMRIVADEEDP